MGAKFAMHKVDFQGYFFNNVPPPNAENMIWCVRRPWLTLCGFQDLFPYPLNLGQCYPHGVFSQVMVWFNEGLINNKLVARPQKKSCWSCIKTSSPNERFQLLTSPLKRTVQNAEASLAQVAHFDKTPVNIKQVTVYILGKLYSKLCLRMQIKDCTLSYFRRSQHYVGAAGDNIGRHLISLPRAKSRY